MINTKRFAAAALALIFSLVIFVVPASAEDTAQPLLVIPASSAVVVEVYYSANYPDEDWYIYNPNSFDIYVATVSNTLQPHAAAVGVSSFDVQYKYESDQNWRSTTWSNYSDTYGVAWGSINLGYNTSVNYSYVTNYSTRDEFLSAVANYTPPVPDPAAELVEAGDSFAFSSDYSINNTSDIDIAVATYNLGYNDIIVACSYETLVVPGTIAGMSVNYNINISARQFNIPVRYTSVVSDGTFSSLSPFESLEDAVSACYSILQDSPNHGGGYTPTVTSFTLQPGNVAYIEMADLSQPIDFGATFSQYSAMFQTAGSYFPGNQLYKIGVDYPQQGDILPGATANQIPWQKNEWGEENLLGQTKVGFASITASSNLVMIYNPYYRGDDSSTVTNPTNINPAIHITSSGIARNGIRVYSLKDSFSAVDGNYYYGIGSTSPTGFADYSQSQNNPNATNPSITGWTDQDGNPTTAPGVTPYNSPPENESLSDVLTGFFNNITGIFTEGHDAIKNLVESSSEFTSRLSSLYAWLPAPVYSVLMSAIILAIIVGVLKVFL